MKKALLLSVVASTMIMAGGDIAPVEAPVEVAAPVAEASGWEFGGQGVLYYQSRDNAATDLFESEVSRAAAGIQLRAMNKDIVGGFGAGVEISGISDLYLYDGVVGGLVQGAGNATASDDDDTVNSSAAFTQAYLTYGIGNTSIKVGRQNLPKALSPFAFSEGWNVFKNSFEAALIVNTDISNTVLVGAYVWRANAHADLTDFTEILGSDKGVYMLTAANSSIENLALTGTWYYAPEVVAGTDDVNIVWADAKYSAEAFNIAVQGGSVLTDTAGLEDTTAFGAKIGGNLGMFDASLAYSSVDDGSLAIENVGTGVKTPLYTQMILNQEAIKHDSDTFVVRAGVKALGGKIGAAYNYSEFGPADVEYNEFDLTYKTKVFNDSTTLFVGYVYSDLSVEVLDLENGSLTVDPDARNLVRVWGRYNF